MSAIVSPPERLLYAKLLEFWPFELEHEPLIAGRWRPDFILSIKLPYKHPDFWGNQYIQREALSVAVECDGYAYHNAQFEFLRDRKKDRHLSSLGYLIARFTAGEITKDWRQVFTEICILFTQECVRKRGFYDTYECFLMPLYNRICNPPDISDTQACLEYSYDKALYNKLWAIYEIYKKETDKQWGHFMQEMDKCRELPGWKESVSYAN